MEATWPASTVHSAAAPLQPLDSRVLCSASAATRWLVPLLMRLYGAHRHATRPVHRRHRPACTHPPTRPPAHYYQPVPCCHRPACIAPARPPACRMTLTSCGGRCMVTHWSISTQPPPPRSPSRCWRRVVAAGCTPCTAGGGLITSGAPCCLILLPAARLPHVAPAPIQQATSAQNRACRRCTSFTTPTTPTFTRQVTCTGRAAQQEAAAAGSQRRPQQPVPGQPRFDKLLTRALSLSLRAWSTR